MDLLLERGRRALTEGDTQLAVEHFSALIDHELREVKFDQPDRFALLACDSFDD